MGAKLDGGWMGRIIYRICPNRGLCTINCSHKAPDAEDPCLIEREKILLYGVVLNQSNGSAISEEYMNEIVYLKRRINIPTWSIE